MRRTTRLTVGLTLAAALTFGTGGAALADGDSTSPFLPDEHASCLGVASSFYAALGVGQVADVAHLVKVIAGYEALPPGARYSDFAQQTQPYHCTGLE